MMGGHAHGELDAEKLAMLLGFRDTVESKGGAAYAVFEPVGFTQQVVAGMIYHVKYRVGEATYIHAKVFVPLPHTQQPA